MQSFVKTAILTLALGAASAAFAQAPIERPDQTTQPQQTAPQSTPMRQPDPAKEAKHLSKQLGLSADQTTQLQGVFTDREQRMQTLMSSNPDQKTMRQQRRAIMQDEQGRINAILTPAQQQQWATMKSERKSHGATQPPPTIS